MEHRKILNFLNEANDSKFFTRNRNVANDNSKVNYGVRNEITYNKKVLKSSVCDNSDVYILVRDDITVTANPQIQVLFKNCTPIIMHHKN